MPIARESVMYMYREYPLVSSNEDLTHVILFIPMQTEEKNVVGEQCGKCWSSIAIMPVQPESKCNYD